VTTCDQGNRISQGISCADVADVCLKALHNPEARNKTFEVWGAVKPGWHWLLASVGLGHQHPAGPAS
jgi:hypothetical protein